MELCVVQILSLEQSIFTNIDEITQTVHYSNACGRQNNVCLLFMIVTYYKVESIPLEDCRQVFLLSHCHGNLDPSGTLLVARHTQSLLPSVAVCSDQ